MMSSAHPHQAQVTGPDDDSARPNATRVLARVLSVGESLGTALPPVWERVDTRERGLLQELCYGTLRWYPQLDALRRRLLVKPLRAHEHEVQALLLIGLYQLVHLRIPPYAAVSAMVTATRTLGKSWAAGLVNAVLRGFERRRAGLLAELSDDPVARWAHPAWLLQRLQADWPDDWPALVAAGNERPPFSLRVNLTRISRADYLDRLAQAGRAARPGPTAAAVLLTRPCEVEALPGFHDGLVSVQDAAAQLAAELLQLEPGQRVLDACAAPGGKTSHLLETEPRLARLLAIDCAPDRLERVRANLQRLRLAAEVRAADARRPADWWDGTPFDRILIDAPCSGTGVIRRHPDIKLLRRAGDIDTLATAQYALLKSLWPLLAPGGRLVYATCSVLPQENEQIVSAFRAAHPDARELPIVTDWGRPREGGRQILPGERDMDGFYYARLVKAD